MARPLYKEQDQISISIASANVYGGVFEKDAEKYIAIGKLLESGFLMKAKKIMAAREVFNF